MGAGHTSVSPRERRLLGLDHGPLPAGHHGGQRRERPSRTSLVLPGSSVGKSAYNAGDIRDAGSILGSGRSPGKGNSNPLQYSCLENPMDRGAWWATVHGVPKSHT